VVTVAQSISGDGVFIADTSAWSHAQDPTISTAWSEAMSEHRLAICPPVELELLYSARSAREFETHETMFSALRRVELSRTVGRAAVTALRELSLVGGLHHRVRMGDALIAACAQEAGIGVLHYDAHFDRLAEVMEFESRWIAPPGSL
jgi:predicted nucleic acid-binding protein